MPRRPLSEARSPRDPNPASGPGRTKDPYIAYLHRFFHTWLPVYDWFARSIFWTYRTAVRTVAPQRGMTVLDVCTGTGEIALRCARRGAAVTGVDVTPEMLAKGRSKAARSERTSAVAFELMDARELAFPDRSFDVAVISFALHDMPRAVRLQVLREVIRVTAGRVVILDYDLPRAALARRLASSLIALFETAYFTTFAREGLMSLLAELKIVRAAGGEFAGIRQRRLFPLLFSIVEIDLSIVREMLGSPGPPGRT